MKQKKKSGRKVISCLLALVMVFSTMTGIVPGMSLTAYAAEQSETFTATGTQNGVTVSAGSYNYSAFFVNSSKSVSISSSDDPITRIVLTDAKKYNPTRWGSSALSASAGTVSFDGSRMTVTDINATSVNIIGIDGNNYATISTIVVYYGTPHTHSFTYSVNDAGDTITATCAEGCPDSYDTTPATLTLAAEGGTYDGTTAYGATVVPLLEERTNGAKRSGIYGLRPYISAPSLCEGNDKITPRHYRSARLAHHCF